MHYFKKFSLSKPLKILQRLIHEFQSGYAVITTSKLSFFAMYLDCKN